MKSPQRPPEWADRILEFFCSERHLDEIQGDLHEWYYYRIKKQGLRKARLFYVFDVARSLRLHRMKSKREINSSLNPIVMYKNYFKTSLRLLLRNKTFSAINILGLSLGIAACILCFIYIQEERNYDTFHSNYENIYRVNRLESNQEKSSVTSGLLAPALKEEYPEVEDALRFLPWFDDVVLSHDDQHFLSDELLIAGANFFDFFDFELIQGDPLQVLARPSTIVLTEELAKSLFGDENPIGKSLKGLNDLEYEVTGVAKRAPDNSHFSYDAIISFATVVPGRGTLNFSWLNRWLTQVVFTFVRLNEETEAQTLTDKLPAFMEKYLPDEQSKFSMYLQPLQEIYLGSNDIAHSRKTAGGNARYIFILSAIALFLLLIGCINYINISTAKATQRAKEISMRKVLGANKSQLMQQFFGEALLMAFLSALIALLLLRASLPQVNLILQKELGFDLFSKPWVIGGLLLLIFLSALLAGIYPAFILASFRIKSLLGAGFRSSSSNSRLRKGLSIVQFGIATCLIAFTILVFQQTRFLQDKPLGFNKDQLIVLDLESNLFNNFIPFKNKLLENPHILSIANSQTVPGSSALTTYISDKPDMQNQIESSFWRVDFDFLKTYDIKIKEGRDFNRQFSTDTLGAVVINESLARTLSLENPLEQRLYFDDSTSVEIVGLAQDFNYESLYHKIAPQFFFIGGRVDGKLSLRLDGRDMPATLAYIKNTWEQFESRYPFKYTFLDEQFASFYEAEQRLFKAIGLFALLCIFIACLGLYGLTAYNVDRLKKEIGIRKVFGAEVADILKLLSKDHLRLIALAFVIAMPVAWLAMRRWLADFTYHVSIAWWIFAAAGVLVLIIALFTVSFQSVKAAVANPAKTLKCE